MITLEELRDLHYDARCAALEPNISAKERLARQNRVRLLREEISRMLRPAIKMIENRPKKAKKEGENR